MGDSVGLGKHAVYDEIVSMRSCFPQIAQRLRDYHAHMLRGRWQQAALADKLEAMQAEECILVIDFMMKWLPSKHAEASKDWYGKKGVSVLGGMLLFQQSTAPSKNRPWR